jgi:phosphate transport system ATP-binding protein
MNQPSYIRVRDLSVFYGRERALKNINLAVPARKITAIIGPSGCGKSTLLKTFNRMLELVEGAVVKGKVEVDGEDIYRPGVEVTAIRKKMGLLSQTPFVLPMSIFENVAYGPRIHGIREKSRLRAIVERRLREAQLWEEVKGKLQTPASRLSVGQQQRLCLARGLAVEPEIILGDEPTSALDPASSRAIEERFGELKKDYTIVIVTHILRQARRLADYVVFLYLGEVVEAAPAEEFFSAPRRELTRSYIGGEIS